MNPEINDNHSNLNINKVILNYFFEKPIQILFCFAAVCYFYGWLAMYYTASNVFNLPGLVFLWEIPHEFRIVFGFIFFLFIVVELFFADLLLWPFRISLVRKFWVHSKNYQLLIRIGVVFISLLYIAILCYLVELSYEVSPFLWPCGMFTLLLMAYVPYQRWYIKQVIISNYNTKATLFFIFATCLLLILPLLLFSDIMHRGKILPYNQEQLVNMQTKYSINETSLEIEKGSYLTSVYLAGESNDNNSYIIVSTDSKTVCRLPKSAVKLISKNIEHED